MGKYQYLEISIYHVARGNFNDAYYLESVYLDLKDLCGEEPVWIDPFCGRSKICQTEIAVKSYSDEEYVILKKQGACIEEHRHPIDALFICSESFDESSLLASHICFRKEK